MVIICANSVKSLPKEKVKVRAIAPQRQYSELLLLSLYIPYIAELPGFEQGSGLTRAGGSNPSKTINAGV